MRAWMCLAPLMLAACAGSDQPARLTDKGNIPSLEARGPIPYGVAIAGGALLAILSGQISPQPLPWYMRP